MNHGEVWWAELGDDSGFRPVAVVSRGEGIHRRVNVTVAEISRTIRSLPSEVPLSPTDGMAVECVINTDNVQTIPKSRLRQRITVLAGERLFALHQALRYSLDLE